MDGSSISKLDPFASKSKGEPNPRMGGIGFFDDLELEEIIAEAPVQITKAGAGIFGDLADLLKGEIIGMEEKKGQDKMPIGGRTEIDFKNTEAAAYRKDFYQRIDLDRKDLEHKDLEQVMEDLVRLEVGAMSTEEKNKTLHLSADLDEKNIRDPYHLHALRMKKMEQIKEVVAEQKDAEMAAQIPNLTLRLDANEGQSMVSQSGAILSAG